MRVNRTGRKPYWFRERCSEILDQEKLVEFVGRVAAGKEQEEKAIGTKLGVERIHIECSIHDRLEAFRMLAEWGIGKPVSMDAMEYEEPLQKVINDNQLLKLLYEFHFRRNGNSNSEIVGNGAPTLQAGTETA